MMLTRGGRGCVKVIASPKHFTGCGQGHGRSSHWHTTLCVPRVILQYTKYAGWRQDDRGVRACEQVQPRAG
jgi:hypothetical protein